VKNLRDLRGLRGNKMSLETNLVDGRFHHEGHEAHEEWDFGYFLNKYGVQYDEAYVWD